MRVAPLRRRYSRGFTLIELLVAIGVVGVLSGVTVVALNPARQFAQARNTQRWSDVRSIANAVKQHAIDHGGVYVSGFDETLRMFGTSPSGCSVPCSGVQEPANAFVDDTQTEFDAGTHANTHWDNGVGLFSGSVGTYTSGIKDALQNVTWTTFGWVPDAPYGKPLPANGVSETLYSAGNANMAGIGVLWHLDESLGQIMDSSGNGKHSTVQNGVTYGTSGRFGTALHFDGNDYVDFPTVFPHDGDPKASINELTAEVWFRAVAPPSIDSTLVWQGWGGSFNIGMNTTGGVGVSVKQTKSGGTDYNGNWHGYNTNPASFADGQWHHITGRYHRAENTLKLFVDGVLIGTPYTGMNASEYLSDPPTSHPPILGATSNINSPYRRNFFTGDLDEVAIYSRALSDAEVLDHYRRGALRLRLQVRTCDNAACSGESFVGPGQSASAYFAESTSGISGIDVSGFPINRYFQYQATFDADEAGESPSLASVSIGNDSVGGVEEMTADACLDITPFLVSDYLSVLPMDPKQGTAQQTYYAAKKRADDHIDIRACGAELDQSIGIVQ